MNRLEAETRAGKPSRIANHQSRVDLVILDELGYLPFALFETSAVGDSDVGI